jgi:RNA polymerase sigma-70 factor (ECF subfamily)
MLSETCVPHPLSPSAASTADDQALIRRVAARDPHAFEELYQRHARRLRGYLRRLLPPHVLPEDVLHEVMLIVWQQAAQCDPCKSLLAWLFGIARHKAMDARRAASPRPMPPPAAAAESAAEALEVQVLRHDLAQTVTQAVAGLPPAERQVVELTYYHDLSYPEIATLLACSVNTVKARGARARHRLAPQLGALGLTPTLAPTPTAHRLPRRV